MSNLESFISSIFPNGIFRDTYCNNDTAKLYQHFVGCDSYAVNIRFLIIPFVLVNHWFLAILDISKVKIYLFDSLAFINQHKINNSCINICNLFYVFRNQVAEPISKIEIFVVHYPFKMIFQFLEVYLRIFLSLKIQKF